jgi:hypothetical protein
MLSCGGYGWFHAADKSAAFQQTQEVVQISLQAWQSGQTGLAKYRNDIFGDKEHPLNFHLAGGRTQLVTLLQDKGWQHGEMLGWGNLLRLLSPSAELETLPIPPQVHHARHEELVMIKQLSKQQRLVLRLWSTPLRLDPDGIEIAIGNVTLQSAENVIGMLTIPRTIRQFDRPAELLWQELKSLGDDASFDSDNLIRLILKPQRP